MAGVKLVLLLAAIMAVASLANLCEQLRRTAAEAQTAIQGGEVAVKDVQRRLDDTSQNVNAALIQISLTADEARQASIEQKEYWSKVSKETIGAVQDARALIQQSTASVQSATADLHGVTTTAQLDLVVLDANLQSLNATIQDVDRNLAKNQDLTRAIAGLADSAAQVKQSTANVTATTEDIRGYVHTLTHPKPQRWFVAIAKGLLDVGYKIKAFL